MGQYQSHGLVTEMHPQLLIHDYLASTKKKSPETAGPVRGSRVTPCNPPPTGGFFIFAPCKTVLQKCVQICTRRFGHGPTSSSLSSDLSLTCHCPRSDEPHISILKDLWTKLPEMPMPVAWEWLEDALHRGEAPPPPLPGPSPAACAREAAARRRGEEGIDVLVDMASHSLRAVGALQSTLSAMRRHQGISAGSRLGSSPGVLGRIAGISIARGSSWRSVVGLMSGVCRSWRGAMRESLYIARALPGGHLALPFRDAGGQGGGGGGGSGAGAGAGAGYDSSTSPSTHSLLEQLHQQQQQQQLPRMSSSASSPMPGVSLPPSHPTAQAAQAAAAAGGRGMAAMSKISKGLLNMVGSDESAKRAEELGMEKFALEDEIGQLKAQIEADEMIKKFQDERICILEAQLASKACDNCASLKVALDECERECESQAAEFKKQKAVLVSEVKRLRSVGAGGGLKGAAAGAGTATASASSGGGEGEGRGAVGGGGEGTGEEGAGEGGGDKEEEEHEVVVGAVVAESPLPPPPPPE